MVVWAKIAENMLTGKAVDIKKQKEGQALAPLFVLRFQSIPAWVTGLNTSFLYCEVMFCRVQEQLG